jgi:7-carboxy-7-deazaguanine synthase
VTYSVKEIYATLQGEGAQTGRAAVLLRFAGCNLWSGREADRLLATCNFCDTDFAGTDGPGGGNFASAADLAAAAAAVWDRNHDARGGAFVICTGGEPLLQIDAPLIARLHRSGFEIAVETNGTIAAPRGLDWICVSPKARAPLVQTTGESFEEFDFRHFFLQPMDGPSRQANTRAAIAFCLGHPRWRLSLQTHKFLGLP